MPIWAPSFAPLRSAMACAPHDLRALAGDDGLPYVVVARREVDGLLAVGVDRHLVDVEVEVLDPGREGAVEGHGLPDHLVLRVTELLGHRVGDRRFVSLAVGRLVVGEPGVVRRVVGADGELARGVGRERPRRAGGGGRGRAGRGRRRCVGGGVVVLRRAADGEGEGEQGGRREGDAARGRRDRGTHGGTLAPRGRVCPCDGDCCPNDGPLCPLCCGRSRGVARVSRTVIAAAATRRAPPAGRWRRRPGRARGPAPSPARSSRARPSRRSRPRGSGVRRPG